jgi:hypothetical protein
MKIINLTDLKYSWLEDSCREFKVSFSKKPWCAAAFSSDFRSSANTLYPNIDVLIDSVPIFLVNQKLSKKFVEIPGCDLKIYVPDDRPKRVVGTYFVFDEWEENALKIIKYARKSVLGLYDHNNKRDFLPSRIFIWIDKIQERAKGNDDNAKALFDFVLTHEQGHALMDIELYGEIPSSSFSYSNDYIYLYIEEAYANAYALTTTMKSLDPNQQKFIRSFVKKQRGGYRKGLDWYEEGCYNYSQWMIIKSDKYFVHKKHLLKKFWSTKDFSVLSR